ncbi:MAG: TlpA family protein disulfide reductase [Chloroflexi bacterium]|nr:TlpA family protein disulfide reductase [Chloroflexota bacterium]
MKAATIAPLVAAACSGGGAPAPSEVAQSASGPPEVGKPAPDFALERLDGQKLALRELRGQVVLVNFWATWCAPCRVEMPIIQQVYNEYQGRGFAVVAVNLGEPRGDVAEYVQLGGYTWNFVLDPGQTVTKRYNILGLPSSFFLDRQGVIRQVHVGPFVSKEQLQQKVASFFQGGS